MEKRETKWMTRHWRRVFLLSVQSLKVKLAHLKPELRVSLLFKVLMVLIMMMMTMRLIMIMIITTFSVVLIMKKKITMFHNWKATTITFPMMRN